MATGFNSILSHIIIYAISGAFPLSFYLRAVIDFPLSRVLSLLLTIRMHFPYFLISRLTTPLSFWISFLGQGSLLQLSNY